MTNQVFFSVIVTLFNKEKYIYQTLKSVCCQTYAPSEIIVINDGSTDASLQEVARVHHSAIRVISIDNQGVSKARNLGASLAKYPWLVFLDGDDLWKENHLITLCQLIAKFPLAKVLSTASEVKTKTSIRFYRYQISNKKYQELDYFKGSLGHSIINSSSVAICAELFSKLKGFNPNYAHYEDVAFWFQLGLHHSIAFANTVTVTILATSNSLSRGNINYQKACLFSEFDAVDTNNKAFYRLLDNNRFSLAILSKIDGEKAIFKDLYQKIKLKHIGLKRSLLLLLPVYFLRFLVRFKKVI
ncbi:glycosyltransferase family 2 protein [Ochrovirga pacifica]|uniref:glycosyltransferase family 2 protein n=1 Tax=Ochrovirga pacifica TaxID=1042376 RepID=UPI00025591A8|nr:glycosyltransferase family A protein [Ochrovirga pacifica]